MKKIIIPCLVAVAFVALTGCSSTDKSSSHRTTSTSHETTVRSPVTTTTTDTTDTQTKP